MRTGSVCESQVSIYGTLLQDTEPNWRRVKKTKKRSSAVWPESAYDYLVIDGIKDKRYVVCDHCKGVFNKHSGTTDMSNHVENEHSEIKRN